MKKVVKKGTEIVTSTSQKEGMQMNDGLGQDIQPHENSKTCALRPQKNVFPF